MKTTPENFICYTDPVEAVRLLGDLNTAISAVDRLSDSVFWDNVLNVSLPVREALAQEGLTMEYFIGINEKLMLARSIVFGDNTDWEGMYGQAMPFVVEKQRERILELEKELYGQKYEK